MRLKINHTDIYTVYGYLFKMQTKKPLIQAAPV